MVAEVAHRRRRRVPGTVVRPVVGTGFRWQSWKKKGEENLQERKRDRRCLLCR